MSGTALPWLEFEPGPHRYRIDGKVVPSVTEILRPLVDLSRVPIGILEQARERGKAVHEACDLYNRGELDEDGIAALPDPVRVRFESYRKFLADTDAHPIASELRVGSRRLQYAGTLDVLVLWKKRGRYVRALCDLKATWEIPDAVGPQTFAYALAYRECTGHNVDARFCVQLDPVHYGYRPLDDPSDDVTFRSCLNIHRWKASHK